MGIGNADKGMLFKAHDDIPGRGKAGRPRSARCSQGDSLAQSMVGDVRIGLMTPQNIPKVPSWPQKIPDP